MQSCSDLRQRYAPQRIDVGRRRNALASDEPSDAQLTAPAVAARQQYTVALQQQQHVTRAAHDVAHLVARHCELDLLQRGALSTIAMAELTARIVAAREQRAVGQQHGSERSAARDARDRYRTHSARQRAAHADERWRAVDGRRPSELAARIGAARQQFAAARCDDSVRFAARDEQRRVGQRDRRQLHQRTR